ncbi:hypothetical protein [Scytonema sp. PRP1]|uniref:hypothetical protein n=1 Tax=Scytonema sp. PRP1 TaxID=3120513 RepID=UPI00300CF880
MLKPKQAESVKSSLYSKNLKSYLVGKFIKSKLYLLILLTVSTGGIYIGNIMVPEQTPPAQAQSRDVVIKILGKGQIDKKVVRIRPGQAVRWVCVNNNYVRRKQHTIQFDHTPLEVPYSEEGLKLEFEYEDEYTYFVDGVPYYIVVSR